MGCPLHRWRNWGSEKLGKSWMELSLPLTPELPPRVSPNCHSKIFSQCQSCIHGASGFVYSTHWQNSAAHQMRRMSLGQLPGCVRVGLWIPSFPTSFQHGTVRMCLDNSPMENNCQCLDSHPAEMSVAGGPEPWCAWENLLCPPWLRNESIQCASEAQAAPRSSWPRFSHRPMKYTTLPWFLNEGQHSWEVC